MVHHYNRIMAKQKINILVDNSSDIKNNDNEDNELKIVSYMWSPNKFHLRCFNTDIGPFFLANDLANQYKKQLLEKYTSIYSIYLASYYNRLPFPNCIVEDVHQTNNT